MSKSPNRCISLINSTKDNGIKYQFIHVYPIFLLYINMISLRCTRLQTHFDGCPCHFKICIPTSFRFFFLIHILLYIFFRLLYSIPKELPSLFLTIAYNPPSQTIEVLTGGLQDIRGNKELGKNFLYQVKYQENLCFWPHPDSHKHMGENKKL